MVCQCCAGPCVGYWGTCDQVPLPSQPSRVFQVTRPRMRFPQGLEGADEPVFSENRPECVTELWEHKVLAVPAPGPECRSQSLHEDGLCAYNSARVVGRARSLALATARAFKTPCFKTQGTAHTAPDCL